MKQNNIKRRTLISDDQTVITYSNKTLVIERDDEAMSIKLRNIPAMLGRLDKNVAYEIAELIPDVEIKECKVCGREFITTYKQQKLCGDPECIAKNKIKSMNAKRQAEKALQSQSQSQLKLARQAAEARQLGMSYGKYKAMLYLKEAPSVLDSK